MPLPVDNGDGPWESFLPSIHACVWEGDLCCFSWKLSVLRALCLPLQNTKARDKVFQSLPFGHILFSRQCLHFNNEFQACVLSESLMEMSPPSPHVRPATSGSPQVWTIHEFFLATLHSGFEHRDRFGKLVFLCHVRSHTNDEQLIKRDNFSKTNQPTDLHWLL